MKTRKPVLYSAACLLLCCTTIAATPVLALEVATTSAQAQFEQDDVDFVDRLLMPNVPPTLMRLEDIADVNDDLFNMPVIDAAGYPVGHFRRVETKVPGDVVAVITLNGSRRTIAVLTDHVRYEPARRLIIADLTTFELDGLRRSSHPGDLESLGKPLGAAPTSGAARLGRFRQISG